jgi:hypothetical protein
MHPVKPNKHNLSSAEDFSSAYRALANFLGTATHCNTLQHYTGFECTPSKRTNTTLVQPKKNTTQTSVQREPQLVTVMHTTRRIPKARVFVYIGVVCKPNLGQLEWPPQPL